MGREVRRVPEDWQHPKDERGRYIPLFDSDHLREWDEGKVKWEQGLKPDYRGGWIPHDETDTYSYEEYAGERVPESDCMPAWPMKQRTHLMMYENTSEGTPLSPAFKTPEELARWLADNNASSFAGRTATYEQWLAMIGDGWSISLVMDGQGMRSGVEIANEK